MPCTTWLVCASIDVLAAARASSRANISRATMIASLNRGRTRGRAVPVFRAVGERHLLEQRRRLAVAERRDDDGDLVARLDQIELPTGAIEDAGTGALDQPFLHLAG